MYTLPCPPDCECEVPECVTCDGYDNLFSFAEDFGFNMAETPDDQFPFSYTGTTLTGITVIPGAVSTITVQTDGIDTFLQTTGCGNSGAPYAFDDVWMFFNGVAKRNFTISYEYYIDTTVCGEGGKHRLLLATSNSVVTGTGILTIGSWELFGTSSEAVLDLRAEYPTNCVVEFPPSEIPNFDLPQSTDTWRTRTLVKDGETVQFSDGTYGPTLLEYCWFNLPGYVGIFLGPGVRIRNINITL